MKTSVDDSDEYVTIFGGNLDELQSAFVAHGLASRGFLILHRIVRHRLIDGRGTGSDIEREPLFAATYCRKAAVG